MSVVERALVIVEEDIVSLGDGFEFYFGLRSLVFGDFVGVVGEGGLQTELDLIEFCACRQGVEGARKF